MELYEIKNGLEKARSLLAELFISIDIEGLKREIEGLTVQIMNEHFWDDQEHAKKIYDQLNEMKKSTDVYDHLISSLNDLEETYEYVKETEDDEFKEALDLDYAKFEAELNDFEKTLLFSGEYDHHNAIIEIHPGAGGTESQDWASMLMRMYQRYGDKKGWKVEVLDYLDGEEAGLKSVTMRFVGYNAYGHLKAEKGVHRLVRISPFDSSKRRHTSFASVDVMPEFDNDIEIDLDMNDVRIDTYRASGAGGQHINKTDSAVRITHIPTGTVTTSQDGRSQHDNKDKAMRAMRTKLYEMKLREQEEAIGSERRNKIGSGDRSEKIRTYNYPQNRVTDHRIGLTIQQLDRIMEGKLEEIIEALINEDQRLKLAGEEE